MGAIFETEEEESSKMNESKNVGSPTKPPLLFLLGEFSGETKHGFFDPIRRTFDVVYLQALECQAECLASRYGWLLILSIETSSLFFFNPLTRQRIDLPYIKRIISAAAFSAPPTSPDCTVYAIKSSTFNDACELHIDTFLIGQESWIPYSYKSTTKPLIANVVQAVCSKDVLYCVDSRGRVGAFDVKDGNWTFFLGKEFQKVCTLSLVEFNGDIFAAKKGAYGVIEKLYKLTIEHGLAAWEEEKDSGDFSVFVGPYGSCGVSAPNEETKEKLFVANCRPESRCVVYNVVGRDYMEAERFIGGSFSCWYNPVWIER